MTDHAPGDEFRRVIVGAMERQQRSRYWLAKAVAADERADVAALKAERQAANEALRDAHLLIMLLRTHVVEIVDHGDFMVAMGYEPSGHATLHERHIRAFNAARVSVAGGEVQT
jgi:hypothetical protein